MQKISKKYEPPFNKFEKKLRLIADTLFFIHCLISILPFCYWGQLKNKLPIEWNDLGNPIAWISKDDALVQFLIKFVFVSLVYSSFMRYGGRPSSENIERVYRLGRLWTLSLMLQTCILFIYEAFCNLNAYLFGFDTPLQSVIHSIFAIFLILSLLGFVISIAEK
jgi:magnesium-transporting ATPase (P-type)